jgi:hypothetical protein
MQRSSSTNFASGPIPHGPTRLDERMPREALRICYEGSSPARPTRFSAYRRFSCSGDGLYNPGPSLEQEMRQLVKVGSISSSMSGR